MLTLLYDKTFPPRPATASAGAVGAVGSAGQNPIGISQRMDGDDMRQFNYYGQGAPNIEEFNEADILKLEKEVEELLKNRITSAAELH